MRCSSLRGDIWRVNLAAEDVENMKISNTFWKDVLWSWCKYNFFCNKRIDNQIIWYNSSIRIKNKPFFWKDNYDKGLKYVYQLFSNGSFKSEDEVWRDYNLTRLRYNSLKVSLPSAWKTFFTEHDVTEFSPLHPHNYDVLLFKKILLGRSINIYLVILAYCTINIESGRKRLGRR